MYVTVTTIAPLDASEVLSGKTRYLKKIPFGSLFAFLLRIEHPAMKVNGRFFKVDADKCSHCNLCVKNCPMQNISVDKDGKFVFGKNCLMCAKCSFNCPTDAFSIALLNGWKVNGKYSFAKPSKIETDRHSWYCKKAYNRYFNEAKKKCENYGKTE